MTKVQLKYNLFCVFLLWLLPMVGHAQRGYTANFLAQVPQQSKYNPAYYTCYKSYVGLPMVSALQFQVNNDAFSISRTFQEGTSPKLIDITKIISNLSEKNNLGVDFSADLLGFGFKIGEENQIHFGLGVEGYGNLLLTKNTFRFIGMGPGIFVGKPSDEALSGNSLDMSVYGALSLGYSRLVTDKLSVGGRVKFISGLANLHTERSDIYLTIDGGGNREVTPYTYTLKPDLVLNGSFANCPKDSNLLYAIRNFGSSVRLPNSFGDAMRSFSLPNSLSDNFGIGFDFGAVYQVSSTFAVAASVYDIGFINWNVGVKRVTSQGREQPFVFSGVDRLNDILGENGFDIQGAFASLTDSLIDYLQINDSDTTFSSYRSSLRTSYNISGFFDITDKGQIGVMWNAQIGRHNRALTIAYTHSFTPMFSLCINNAIINNSAINFGGGFAVNMGPVQFYAVLDKVSAFRVIDMRAVNVQFGLNIVLNQQDKDLNKRRYRGDLTPRDKTGYVGNRWAY
jgi:hypothetical protein